jgi:hypothetical protein
MKFFCWSLALAVLGASGLAARADELTHEVQKATTHATPGAPGKAAVTIQGKNGWHVNENAPITLNAKADPGVDLPKPKLARADLTQSTKETARFEIPFTASAAGKKTITAETRFVMCQEQACKPVKETVALDIDVADAPATPPAPGKSSSKKAGKAKTASP